MIVIIDIIIVVKIFEVFKCLIKEFICILFIIVFVLLIEVIKLILLLVMINLGIYIKNVKIDSNVFVSGLMFNFCLFCLIDVNL